MGRGVEFSKLYLRERLSLFPWMLIPIILFFLGHKNSAPFEYILSYSLLWGVFFFRTLSDFFSWSYNKNNSNLNYTRYHRQYMIVLLGSFFLLFMSSGLMIYTILENLYILATIFISILLYVLFKNSSLIRYVPILGFSLLLALVSAKTDNANPLWVIIGILYLVVKFVAKYKFNRTNSYMEAVVLASFFVSKYALNF